MKICFSPTHVCTVYLVVRVSPPAAAETDRFSPFREAARDETLEPADNPCRRLPVYKGLCRYFLSPFLSISLSRCLFVFFSLSFLLSAFLLVRKNGRRRGAKGVQSPGQISSTARECEWRDVFAKTLCMYRFSKVRCNYSASTRVQRDVDANRREGKEEETHSTTSERKREARIVPWTSVRETNVRGSLLKRGKTHQPPLLRDPFMSRPFPQILSSQQLPRTLEGARN